MEVLKIIENYDGKNALMEISLEEDEIKVLLELAVNNILVEAIAKHEAEFLKE